MDCIGYFSGKRMARIQQWGAALGAKPLATASTGIWGRSPHRSKILYFFGKNNLILGLFW